ncbi:NAD-dependent epimerase/dehydratase family protein [Microbacterium luticocti]|uniref:NAD-dependent epimerase/dehydratase family protein n=1 Tax=Microbacterium luticocti TaxID=451764 RepID=UPI00048C78CA|nr:NAD-dependent epimerase/dehydratase family protein [Microbacterium luticocti]
MNRRTLVVGGTGMIGSHIVDALVQMGDEVTVLARRPASPDDPPAVSRVPRLVGDYTTGSIEAQELEGFDAVVFAAGNDTRHVSAEREDAEFWARVQSDGVPAFAALAKQAGVHRFVQIGSYYHQLRPELARTVPYVAARQAADERTRALTDGDFAAITLNPPSIVGAAPGAVLRRFARMIAWVRGERTDVDLYAPPGGTNYMSARSLAQAVGGALNAGEPGRAYLIGDVNLTYREYFQLLADVAGSDRVIGERDREHPYQPDRFIVQGRGEVISYEPDPDEVALLGYTRQDVVRALNEIVATADAMN